MNSTYFKAARPDGTDFRTGKVHWLPADGAPIPEGGWLVEHPASERVVWADPRTYLSVSTVETDCSGMRWPCRLLRVIPDGRQVSIPEPVGLPSKRASIRWRVTEELPAWQALGPQGREIETLIGQVKSLTEDQALELSAAWGTPWGVGQFDTWDSIRRAAWSAAWSADRSAAWSAARSAAWSADLGTDWSAAQSSVRTAVLDADWDTDWSAGHPTVLDAAMDAVRGLMLLDLEPDVAEILLAPWVSVMGRSWEVPA